MSRISRYRDALEARCFPLPIRLLGTDPARRARELDARLPLAAVFGLRTAAWLHGLDILPRSVSPRYWPVEVIVPRRVDVPGLPGLRVYRWGLGTEVELVDGLLATTRSRTALDCAAVLPRLDAVAAVDQFLRGGVELGRLRCSASRLRHSARRVVESVLDVTDGRAESPLESWTRCLIVDSGLPSPTAQLPVELPDGSIARVDLGYRRFKVGIECQGRRYHASESARENDAARRQALQDSGWSIQNVHGSDVVAHPDDLLAELKARLRRRGWRPPAGRSERIERRIRYIAMVLRLDREDWNAAWGLPAPMGREARRNPRW